MRHKKSCGKRESGRIKAVLLRDENWPTPMIAQALRIHEAKILNIDLIYLPPYNPNLNPIERLWKVMNKQARNGEHFASTKEFRRRIGEFFTITLPEIADSLDSWINDNFQVLKPAL